MLDHIIVETGGVKMPLSRLAVVSVLDPKTLSVTPYDLDVMNYNLSNNFDFIFFILSYIFPLIALSSIEMLRLNIFPKVFIFSFFFPRSIGGFTLREQKCNWKLTQLYHTF